MSHYHWYFVLQNVPQASAALTLLGYSVDNDMLHATEHHDYLLSLNYIRDNDATEEECSKEHGCCIVFDKRVKCIQSGSASRTLGHMSTESGSEDRACSHIVE